MTRVGAVFWLVLVLVAGFTTFKVKYAVQDTEDQLNRVRRQTVAEQQEIRVLTAEWTYLNQPDRLAELNRRFLSLSPISAKQLQRSITDIPMRASPAAPDVLLASSLDDPPAHAAAAGTPVVAAAAGDAPAAQEPPRAEPPPTGAPDTVERPHTVLPVRLAKAEAPNSLDALIAQIADTR